MLSEGPELIKMPTHLVREMQNTTPVLVEGSLSGLEAQADNRSKHPHHQPKHLLHLHFWIYYSGIGIIDQTSISSKYEGGRDMKVLTNLMEWEKIIFVKQKCIYPIQLNCYLIKSAKNLLLGHAVI